MTHEAVTERIARQLLDRERGDSADAASEVAAAERVLHKLNLSLRRWFGREGMSAVLNRSLTQARAKHRLLEGASFTFQNEGFELTGVPTPAPEQRAELTSALASAIGGTIEVLRRFIGDAMVARLLEGMWEGELPAGMFEGATQQADDLETTDGESE